MIFATQNKQTNKNGRKCKSEKTGLYILTGQIRLITAYERAVSNKRDKGHNYAMGDNVVRFLLVFSYFLSYYFLPSQEKLCISSKFPISVGK